MSQLTDGFVVSVVIVCYNSKKWLSKCLDSVKSQTIFSRLEVIIVDNASQDDSEACAKLLTKDWPNARVLQTGANIGYCAANNRGAEIASGTYLYLLNPDAWMEDDCLEQFVTIVEKERIGCAGGLVLEYDDNTVQAKGCHGFDFCGNGVTRRTGRDPCLLFFIHGFFFIRRELYMELGGLDESLFMYGEEMDLAWRVWISGGGILPVLTARVHHRGAASVNPVGETRIIENRTSANTRFLANRNSLVILAKNCHSFLLLMILPCILIIMIECLFFMIMTREFHAVIKTYMNVFSDCWRLRHHIFEERSRIKSFRKHGDIWMLRFFRLGFGRWYEIESIVKRGFPKINKA